MIVLTPGVSLGVCLRTMKKRLCCASEDKERRSVSVLEKNKFCFFEFCWKLVRFWLGCWEGFFVSIHNSFIHVLGLNTSTFPRVVIVFFVGLVFFQAFTRWQPLAFSDFHLWHVWEDRILHGSVGTWGVLRSVVWAMKKRLCCASEDKERRWVSVLEKNKFWTCFGIWFKACSLLIAFWEGFFVSIHNSFIHVFAWVDQQI